MGFSTLLAPASASTSSSSSTSNNNATAPAGASSAVRRKSSTTGFLGGTTNAFPASYDGVPEYISDESQLPLPEPEAPDLRDLNNSLEALAAVFPDIQIDVFREMLSSFDGESRLALVADALLKNRVTWVKGRWRVAEGGKTPATAATAATTESTKSSSSSAAPPPTARGNRPAVPRSEIFRTPEYKAAVRTLACHEFKGLSRSTILAVLAEQNYSYLDARRALVDLSSKSWRFAFSSLFLRRRSVTYAEAENHPLIVWKSSGQGSIIPCIRATGNAELDRELYGELVAPLKARAKVAQEEKDHALAFTLNAEEAEAADATYECACCFTTAAFEEFTTCSAEGHMICFRCVQHSVTEAVFGQGWHRSIDKDRGTLRCPAVDRDECTGCIPPDHLYRAMLEEKKGAEIMHNFERRLAEHNLLSSQLPLVRCPFCDYAEVDDVYLPYSEAPLRPRLDSMLSLILLLLCVGTVPFLLPVLLFSSFVALLLSSNQTVGDYARKQFSAALARHRRRRRGLKFRCQDPACGRVSCLSCAKEWADIHVCHESSLVALRTQVEQAMSMAIKRVCPRCNTSFVKTAGCNKLTCPCGYRMCYVCRKDIGDGAGDDVGYRHFCQHFRPEGDGHQCVQCNRCNLWEAEDTESVLKAAREEVERKWRDMERRELSSAERAFLETGVAVKAAAGGDVQTALVRGRLPSVPDVFDWVVDTIFV